MHNLIIEGTWKEVSERASALGQEARVRLEVLEGRGGKMITKGMFPQLKALTEDDFKSAEWHGPSSGDL